MSIYLLADLIFIVVALLGAAFLGFILGRRSLRRRFARAQNQEQEQQQTLTEALAQLKRSKDRRTALQRELSEVRNHLSASAINAPRASRATATVAEVSAAPQTTTTRRPSHRSRPSQTPTPAQNGSLTPKPPSKQEEALARVRKRATRLDLTHLGDAEASQRDDLKQIDGIGIFTEKKLNALGIYTVEQVARLRPEDEPRINAAIELPPGRIARDQWVAQAQHLSRKR